METSIRSTEQLVCDTDSLKRHMSLQVTVYIQFADGVHLIGRIVSYYRWGRAIEHQKLAPMSV